ncbi:MAG: MaoC family dehydratase [Synergistaceae bacterium]|jgi:3-hydroxybutyryl-CoA dehydratase|nr:MaoC family dehydratase [Synergistaceae bacterium]
MARVRYVYSDLAVGMRDELTRTVTQDDVRRFAEVTGDFNPVHVDADFAAKTRFGRVIAHGSLGAGFISAVMGTKLPGPGAVYMEQTLRFVAPVFIGDTITAAAEITELIPAKYRVRLSTTCRKEDGSPVIEGTALLMFKVLSKD